MKTMIKILCGALCALALTACGERETEPTETQIPTQTETEAPSETRTEMPQTEGEEPFPSIEIQENREGELVFSISVDDFAERYNALCRADGETEYMTDPAQWKQYSVESAVHSDYEMTCYQFSENEKAWSLPTLTVYVPTDGDVIHQVMVNFDEHSRTESLYSLYEEMCFYTLKIFFPDLSDETITGLYTELNELAYDNVFPHEQGYDRGAVPCALYYRDGIGVYPYFAVGEWVHLCLVPMSDEEISDWESKGVQVCEIVD